MRMEELLLFLLIDLSVTHAHIAHAKGPNFGQNFPPIPRLNSVGNPIVAHHHRCQRRQIPSLQGSSASKSALPPPLSLSEEGDPGGGGGGGRRGQPDPELLEKGESAVGAMSFADLESGRPLGGRREPNNGRQDPAQAVAAGVFQINTAVSTFQRLVNTLGTPKDTPELREKLHKTRLHIGQLVKDTSAKLKQASETDYHAEVSASKKIADAKLAKDFQAVLKEFQKAQRLAAEREMVYTPFVPQTVLPSSYTASEIDVSSNKTPEERALLVESRRQEVLLLDNEIVFNEAIIEEREQGIQEVQQQIGEVNEIFKDLAVLVHDQGIMIDDIESNIENTHAATGQAKVQLAKASKTQRSNSSLTCLLLVIFGIVLLIVIIVLAA